MLGFGKNKQSSSEKTAPEAQNKNKQTSVGIDIPEDKFTVMPQQYLPQKGKTPKIPDAPNTGAAPTTGINKKFLILGSIAFAVIAVMIVVLYMVFISSGETQLPVAQAPVAPAPAQPSKEESEEPSITEKIISTQAYDSGNILIGSMEITIPATVAQAFGTGIGITSLLADDLTLPEEGTVIGGLYSVYPSGVSFDEALSIYL